MGHALVLAMLAPPVLMHLGALHPVEKALTVVLAFGPFVLLGVVVWVRRRQDQREEELLAAEEAARATRPEQ